jgi:hypothetical protein
MAKVTAKLRAERQARVERLNTSGLSVGDFAAQEGIQPGTLALWRSRLGPIETPSASSTTALAFIALEPVARPTQDPVPFDVNVTGGRSIRVWPRFDAAELARRQRRASSARPGPGWRRAPQPSSSGRQRAASGTVPGRRARSLSPQDGG